MDDFQKLEPVRFHQTLTLFEVNCFLLFPVIIFKILIFNIIIDFTSTQNIRQGIHLLIDYHTNTHTNTLPRIIYIENS